MLLPALVALSLALSAGNTAGQSDPYEEDDHGHGGDDTGLFLAVRGGEAVGPNGGGAHPVYGGEIGWSFEPIDLSLAGYAYKDLDGKPAPGEKSQWNRMYLVRLGQRFETYRGLEGTLDLGIGAAHTDKWKSWVQLGLGVHLNIDPLFVTGEITFEQNGLVRLTAGLGARF
ncbi:MAG: hypothetical protein QM704_00145 [Anaeromyxobacteraceae bacterium]